nr:hypothetical protein GCM10020093_111380 [Planobispora longispora]
MRLVGVLIAVVSVALECANIVVTAKLPQPDYTPLPFAPEDMAGTAFPIFGALLIFRRPRLPIGWLLAVGGLACAVNILTINVVRLEAPSPHVHIIEASPSLGLVVSLSWILATLLLGVALPLLYPTGRLPSPRWRPLVVFACLVQGLNVVRALLMALDATPYSKPFTQTLQWSMNAAMALAFVSLAVRFHRGDPVERRRIVWPLFAFAGLLVPWVVGGPIWWLASFTIPLIPAAIAFAILRHGLYDIDTLITRALVGAGLVGVIGGVYVAVGAASSLFLSGVDRVGGLLAALCAGAFFHPLRRILQRGADRLLYGSKGDPVTLAGELRRRLQRTDPAEGLPAALEVLREGLSVTGVAVRFPDGRPVRTTVGDLGETAREIPWSGTASRSATCSSALRGPGGCRPPTTSGSSPRSRRTSPTPRTRSGWSPRCATHGSGSSPPARRNAAASAATSTTAWASRSAAWPCPSTRPGTTCTPPRRTPSACSTGSAPAWTA